MNAQYKWKTLWLDIQKARLLERDSEANEIGVTLLRYRREAALERKLEAAQRKIDKQDRRIGELEQMLKLYFDGLPTGPAGYTSWPVAPLHDMARNVLNQ